MTLSEKWSGLFVIVAIRKSNNTHGYIKQSFQNSLNELFYLYSSISKQIFLPLVLIIILSVILVYGLLCIVFYFIQERFLFQPEVLPQDFKYKYEYPVEEVFFEPKKGVRINGLHFKIPNSKGVVYYFKGNTRSIKGWGKFARDFINKGYDFFMIDYRGFGKSRGKRSEDAIYADGQIAYQYLKEVYGEENIIIYGRSIGSGFATKIAAQNSPKKLILDSPYFSMLYLLRGKVPILPIQKLLKYHIRTDLFLPDVKSPVYIIHGLKDRLIPFRHGRKLTEVSNDGKLITIEGGGHNNLPNFSKYHETLRNILNGTFISAEAA